MFSKNILIFISAICLVFCCCTREETNSRPNIIWILAEDLSPDLGCYGNELVSTPHIDWLASEGRQFMNVFTTAPACTPSRTALATGLYQISLDAHHMRYPEQLEWSQYIQPGSMDDNLICAIDITSTSLSMAGIKIPASMQGQVFLGPKKEAGREYVFAAADRLGETFFKSRSIRGKKYHYIRNYNHDLSVNSSATAYRRAMHPIWHVLLILHEKGQLKPVQQALLEPMAEEELYDLEKDPFEIHNLATDPACREVLNELKDRLVEWQAEVLDHGMFPDPPELQEHFRQYGITSEKQHAKRFRELKERVENEIKGAGP